MAAACRAVVVQVADGLVLVGRVVLRRMSVGAIREMRYFGGAWGGRANARGVAAWTSGAVVGR